MESASSCRSGIPPARSVSALSPPPITAVPWESFLSTTSPTSAHSTVRLSTLYDPARYAHFTILGCCAPPLPGGQLALPVALDQSTNAFAFEPLIPSTKHKTNSLADIRTWFQNVEQHATEGVNKILIGNKCDWEEKRVVSTEQGQGLADELGIPFLEVSAKSNINIDKAFYSLAADIKKRLIDNSKNDQPAASGVNVNDKSEGGGSKCC